MKMRRWLLFLRHCAKCQQNETDCQLKGQCKFGKLLWQHILECTNTQCDYSHCASSKKLLLHHKNCTVSHDAVMTVMMVIYIYIYMVNGYAMLKIYPC